MNTQLQISTDTELKGLPPRTHPLLRLNSLCPYCTMFPLSFPFGVLVDAAKDDWVLDPFCGRGTTNFAARLRGLPSIGIDSNPVAAAIASAKFTDVSAAEVCGLCESIIRDDSDPSDVPVGPFWELCYHSETLRDICKLREYFRRGCSTHAEIALRALILGILHGPLRRHQPSYLSNQMPRTYATKPEAAVRFWEARRMRPPKVDVVELVRRRAHYSFSQLPGPVDGTVYLADSRKLDVFMVPKPVTWVVTSPPYYGMRSYCSDQWLRHWFLGGPPDVTYKHDGQVSHHSEEDFVFSLAAVWDRVASVCTDRARLVVRFGALPSVARDPREILMRSFAQASARWVTTRVVDAGFCSQGRRQAGQFCPELGKPIQEIDVHAVLEG